MHHAFFCCQKAVPICTPSAPSINAAAIPRPSAIPPATTRGTAASFLLSFSALIPSSKNYSASVGSLNDLYLLVFEPIAFFQDLYSIFADQNQKPHIFSKFCDLSFLKQAYHVIFPIQFFLGLTTIIIHFR